MTMDPVLADARERLLGRAKREGLTTVGYDLLPSPLGPLWVAITPRGVATIHYGEEPSESELRRLVRVYGPGIVPDHRRSSDLARELDQYFNGKRRAFDIAYDLSGLTPFQTRVLNATAKIPFGSVSTYGASRSARVTRKRRERPAARSTRIRSRSSCRATGSWARPARSSATPAVST